MPGQCLKKASIGRKYDRPLPSKTASGIRLSEQAHDKGEMRMTLSASVMTVVLMGVIRGG